MKRLSLIKKASVWTLVFQMTIGLQLLSNGGQTAQASGKRTLTEEDFSKPILETLKLDPTFDAFANSPALPAPEFQADDSAIDRDPFFLRSQNWSPLASHDGGEDVSFTKENDSSVTIHIPAIQKSLHLRQGLTPVALTDEYLFLTVDDDNDLLARASGKLDSGEFVGEGIFFINYRELLTTGRVESPVHVHFFPLPGSGWKGQISVEEFADLSTLSVVSRQGVWLPIDLADIRQVEKVEAFNGLLGSYVATRSPEAAERLVRGIKTGNAKDLGLPLPSKGSTYGFGLLFTGIDLDHPEHSLWSPARSSFFSDLLMPKAYAGLDPALVDRVIRFGWTFGAMTAFSVALKYTLLKDKFVERRALLELRQVPELEFDVNLSKALFQAGIATLKQLSEATPEQIAEASKIDTAKAEALKSSALKVLNETPEEKPGWISQHAPNFIKDPIVNAKIGVNLILPPNFYREVKESGDALASVLTMSRQIPAVVTANVVERLTDRYLPGIAAGENKLMRKIVLQKAVYWYRSVSRNTPVNMKTFMLGAVWMGSIDTASVYIQLMHFNPWLCQAIAPYLSPALEERVMQTFDPNNPFIKNIAVNEVVRNYVAWMTAGASGYSQDSQAQAEPLIKKSVAETMKKMGKDPLDPKNKEEFEELYQAAMNTKLKQLGLPDKIYFLFDTNSVDSRVVKFLGFQAPDKAKAELNGRPVLAESRPALVASSLNSAIKRLRKEIRTNPAPAKIKALEILESTRKSLSLFSLDLAHPIESFKAHREVTSMLSLLTYAGDVDAAVKFVPELWSNVDPDGATEAAVRFRQAFFAYYTGDGYLRQLPDDFVKANIAKASAEVQRQSKADSHGAALSQGEFARAVEQRLREMYADTQQTQEIETYQFPKKNWYEKIQHRRALRVAEERYERDGHDPASGKPAEFRRYYAEALANTVGLFPASETDEERNLLEYVVKKANIDTDQEIASNPGLKKYLEKASQQERSEIELSLYGKNYLDTYTSATIDDRLVPPRSPAQPGITQRLRQKKFVRDSKWLTVLLRIADSGVSDEAGYKTGLKAKLYRTVPFYFDMEAGVSRTIKMITTSSTTGWEFNKVLWGVKLPFASNLLNILMSPFIVAPSQWLNRAFRQQGLEPMEGFLSKAIYGVPYAWVTFGGTIPLFLYAKDFKDLIDGIGTSVATSPVAQWFAANGKDALPFLPALLVAPIAKEYWDRKVTQKAAREASEAALKEPQKQSSQPTFNVLSCESVFLE